MKMSSFIHLLSRYESRTVFKIRSKHLADTYIFMLCRRTRLEVHVQTPYLQGLTVSFYSLPIQYNPS